MSGLKNISLVVALSFALTACSIPIVGGIGGGGGPKEPPMPTDGEMPTGDNGGFRKVGDPYKIAGITYYPKDEPYYDEVGIASWYGKQFHGKRTANGEIYNMNALTAAHKTLAMPSYVKVTNLKNGRSIVVRVNDRGPFAKGRIIDMSRRGAQLLGFSEAGTVKVRVQAVDENGNLPKKSKRKKRKAERVVETPKLSTVGSGSILVVVGSFRDHQNAMMRVDDLKNAGQDGRIIEAIVNGVKYYRVGLGPFKSQSQADKVLKAVQNRGFYDARIVTSE